MEQMDEWRRDYPEAFERDYDYASGLHFNGWVEEGEVTWARKSSSSICPCATAATTARSSAKTSTVATTGPPSPNRSPRSGSSG